MNWAWNEIAGVLAPPTRPRRFRRDLVGLITHPRRTGGAQALADVERALRGRERSAHPDLGSRYRCATRRTDVRVSPPKRSEASVRVSQIASVRDSRRRSETAGERGHPIVAVAITLTEAPGGSMRSCGPQPARVRATSPVCAGARTWRPAALRTSRSTGSKRHVPAPHWYASDGDVDTGGSRGVRRRSPNSSRPSGRCCITARARSTRPRQRS